MVKANCNCTKEKGPRTPKLVLNKNPQVAMQSIPSFIFWKQKRDIWQILRALTHYNPSLPIQAWDQIWSLASCSLVGTHDNLFFNPFRNFKVLTKKEVGLWQIMKCSHNTTDQISRLSAAKDYCASHSMFSCTWEKLSEIVVGCLDEQTDRQTSPTLSPHWGGRVW